MKWEKRRISGTDVDLEQYAVGGQVGKMIVKPEGYQGRGEQGCKDCSPQPCKSEQVSLIILLNAEPSEARSSEGNAEGVTE